MIRIFRPSTLLRPFVKYYWTLENCAHSEKTYIQRIVPSGLPELSFYFGDAPTYERNDQNVRATAVLNGQQDHSYKIRVMGRLEMLSVIFQPYAAKLFFDLPASELMNRSIPAEDLEAAFLRELEPRLCDCFGAEQKVQIIESFLLNSLSRKKEYELRRICSSLSLINANRGSAGINDLAASACLSRKQFERSFSEFIGISPKKFQKVIRFQSVLHQKNQHPEISLTGLAVECGYFDQSHMIRDFKQLSGLTPAQYFSDCQPVSDYFSF